MNFRTVTVTGKPGTASFAIIVLPKYPLTVKAFSVTPTRRPFRLRAEEGIAGDNHIFCIIFFNNGQNN